VSQQGTVAITVTAGPSLFAPFPAAVAEFPLPAERELTPTELEPRMRAFLPPPVLAQVALPLQSARFEDVAGLIANALQDLQGPNRFGLVSAGEPRGDLP